MAKYPAGKEGLKVFHEYMPDKHEVWVKGYGIPSLGKTMTFDNYVTASWSWILSTDKTWIKLQIKPFTEDDHIEADRRHKELVSKLRNGTAIESLPAGKIPKKYLDASESDYVSQG